MSESKPTESHLGNTDGGWPWGTVVTIRLDERTMDRIVDDLNAMSYEGLTIPRWELKAALAAHALSWAKPAK